MDTDTILWEALGVSDRAIIMDSRYAEAIGTVTTGDRQEKYNRAGAPGIAADCAALNAREPEPDRFQVVLLPPGVLG